MSCCLLGIDSWYIQSVFLNPLLGKKTVSWLQREKILPTSSVVPFLPEFMSLTAKRHKCKALAGRVPIGQATSTKILGENAWLFPFIRIEEVEETSNVPIGPGSEGKFYTISAQTHGMVAWQVCGVQIFDLWLRVTSSFRRYTDPHQLLCDATIVRRVVKS